MKHILSVLILCVNVCFVWGQAFEVETIKVSGPNDKRINLVILSEGYQSSELSDFVADVAAFSNAMFNESPFKEYANYFNVYAIKVPSNQSGADHPGTATDVDESGATPVFVDTYFNATFDAFGYHRFLYYGIDYANAASAELKIRSVLADNFPDYDQALILVNTEAYGGTGGEFPIASASANGNGLALHELGHSMFNLKDEYYPGDALAAEAINMTQETNANLVRWKNWINTSAVGIYPYGTSGTAATWNRPHQNCKMRYLGYAFCAVCREGVVEKLHDILSPIEEYSPVLTAVNNPSFPVDFQLELIKPNPNTLERVWILNDNDLVNNVDEVTIEESQLVEGENTLTVAVHDNSNYVRVDNHESIHISIVTWRINYSTLGIEAIDSEEHNLTIDMFPNPTDNTVNFKFENNKYSNIKIDIVGVDGKRVKSFSVSNYNSEMLDVSNLEAGVYIVNFYTGNVYVASKKLLKN